MSSLGRAWMGRRHKARWGRAYGATDPAVVFTSHFERNYWGSLETASGPGSTLAAARILRDGLPRMFGQLGTRRLFDAYHWIRQVTFPENMRYLGGTSSLLRLRATPLGTKTGERPSYNSTSPATPFRRQICGCAVTAFAHLPEEMVFAALAMFTRFAIPWLLTTSHDNDVNEDGCVGGFRLLNVERPPYAFPAPTAVLDDGVPGAMKRMGLWSRLDVLAAIERRGGPS